ncbi:GcrA family cell cycle regulator [Prosthecomicrobium sp. N25]|uniref:GcrA family cell cycle regulator n=1 Tax=Prosthecomicrobium sp. N25 TaxID=3129254 RepID=UPI0030785E5D
MSWTDERVELLKKLWADGLSASQIAAELGGVTRNAVIGKVHRLGLSGRAKAPAPQAAQRPKKAVPAVPAARPQRPAAGPISIGATALKSEIMPVARPQPVAAPRIFTLADAPLVENASILQLTEQTCKWPVGDPGQDSFHFCARRSEAGIPYCGYHSRIAYQPVSDRRRDRRVGVA